jgi:hypothetical protein
MKQVRTKENEDFYRQWWNENKLNIGVRNHHRGVHISSPISNGTVVRDELISKINARHDADVEKHSDEQIGAHEGFDFFSSGPGKYSDERKVNHEAINESVARWSRVDWKTEVIEDEIQKELNALSWSLRRLELLYHQRKEVETPTINGR